MSVRNTLRLAGLPVAVGMTAWLSGQALAAENGAITVVLSEEPDIIDPCEASRSNVGRVVKQNITETLTEIDPKDGSIQPRLATEWEQLDDNTWRFKLREGVTFHDGEPFNAAAVKTAIERTLDDRIDCEIRIKFFGNLEVMPEVVDDHTIDLKTSNPAPILPTMMGTMTITSPNTVMGERTRDPVGTGPYTFGEWNVGENIVLNRFDDYWGEQPDVETANYVWRSESAVRAAMIEAGEADIAPNIAVQDATNPDLDHSYPNSETSRARIDTTRAPLDDIRVRQALNLGLDREAYQGTIFSEDVEAATQLIVPSINGHNPDLQVWPYDPEKAKALLDEARADGVPVDDEIVIIGRIGIYPNATEASEAMMAMYQELGLNVKLQMYEVAEWIDLLTKPFAEDRPPALQMSQHDNNNGDAVFTVYNKYHTEGGQSMLNDPELDALIEAAEVATGDERRATWQAVFKRINDDLIADIPLFHMVGYTRVGPDIEFTPDISTNSELQISQIKLK
ncbi:MAG: ABC transporter substrate-binding protein [Pseudomonadota bacterium]